MNTKELIEEYNEKIKKLKDLEKEFPGIEGISQISIGYIFMESFKTFEDIKSALRKLPKPQKILNYYTSAGFLALHYQIKETDFNFYIQENIQETLDLISDGKCKLETTTETKTTEEVVCLNK